jgi:hypothetical protein
MMAATNTGVVAAELALTAPRQVTAGFFVGRLFY